MLEQTDTDYVRVLGLMGLTWEEYAQLFRTRGQVFGIYSDEQLVGFYWIELRGVGLHLHGLILEDGFHGKGIGTAVLKKLEHDYKEKAHHIELGVDQTNMRAKALYERIGYEVVEVLDDVGFYVMQKQLSHEELG
jgi:ribosomal protein S18 acetylase RimI-like enzyme